MAVRISMKVNGKPASAEVEERTLLVTFLRETLRLTGTHVGCDTAQCGACTGTMNGRAVKSCSMIAMQRRRRDPPSRASRRPRTLHPMQARSGASRPAMRLLHALHGDDRDRLREGNAIRARQQIREALDGNCAAARLPITSKPLRRRKSHGGGKLRRRHG